MARSPIYRGLGWPEGWFGWVRKISPPPGFDPLSVQPVVRRYTDWAIPAHINNNNNNSINVYWKQYSIVMTLVSPFRVSFVLIDMITRQSNNWHYVKPHHDCTKRKHKIKIRAKLKTQAQKVSNLFNWKSEFKKGRNYKTLLYVYSQTQYIIALLATRLDHYGHHEANFYEKV